MATLGTSYTTSSVSAVAAPTAPLPTSASGVVAGAADRSLGREVGAGAASPMVAESGENSVAANPARKVPVDLNSLQDQTKRTEFVKNITQLDGVQGGSDEVSCGPTALVASMTMADPKSTQKLAAGLLNQSFNDRSKMFGGGHEFSEKETTALTHIRDGNASPADVQSLAQVMSQMKGTSGEEGTTDAGMARMISNTTQILGKDMPNLELHMYANAKQEDNKAHWQGYANGVEIDPWPNAQGQSTITPGSAGLAQGASHYENGAVYTKMIVQDHGKRLTIPRYLGVDSHGQRVSNPDTNTPLTVYEYKQDTFGYGYSRTSGREPAGLVWEPGDKLGG